MHEHMPMVVSWPEVVVVGVANFGIIPAADVQAGRPPGSRGHPRRAGGCPGPEPLPGTWGSPVLAWHLCGYVDGMAFEVPANRGSGDRMLATGSDPSL